jgi:glycoprotein-N-acetylgalactosamine 3-beta-galactosyltransferase
MFSRLVEFFFFFIGFISGVYFYLIFFGVKENLLVPKNSFESSENLFDKIIKDEGVKYNTSLADYLFNTIKIACLVLTQPANHETKAKYAKSTWGYKCNKLVFLSTVKDDNLGSIALPFNESREILWGKTRGGFAYAYKNFYDEVDWVLKADDDS